MGVFIYKTKGNFPNNFTIEAVDVLLMAKGSTAEVGYVTDAQLISDLDDLNYLEGYSRGLIHSHNNMGTSFSGTDVDQLKLAASTGPYYLSVVVNNDMDFTAKVAIKSTEEYKGYSFFKNLFGKQIKTPKEFKRESYEIVECEIEAEYPQFMLDVDQRIKDRLQHYVTPTTYKPVGSGNSISNGSKNGWEDDDWQKPAYMNHRKTFQPSLFQQGHLAGVVDEDIIEGFIEAGLEKYCRNMQGLLFSPEICAKNIVEDAEHFGIGIEDYIGYLEVETFVDLDRDQEIINALKKYKQ